MDEIPLLFKNIHLIIFILLVTFVFSFWITAIIVEKTMKRINGRKEKIHE